MNKKNLKVSIVMGSQSDFKTMKLAKQILKKLKGSHGNKDYFCTQNSNENV